MKRNKVVVTLTKEDFGALRKANGDIKLALELYRDAAVRLRECWKRLREKYHLRDEKDYTVDPNTGELREVL